jgi:hypothetical protein
VLDIQKLRELGGGLSNLTDEQIARSAHEAYRGYYPDFNDFAKRIGYAPEDDFVRGLKMGGRQTLAAGAGALAMGADAIGATGARDYMLDAARNQSNKAFQLSRRSDDVDNFREDPLSFLSAGAGQVAAFAIPSLVSGGLGAGVAAARGGSMLLGAAAGSYGANFAQEAGGIYNELADQGRYEPGRAAAYGAGAAVLDTATEAIPFARGAFRGGLPTRMLKGAALQAPIEAGTETIQTGIERAGAYKDLNSDEAWSDYRNAAALGAIGGAGFGGATGAFSRAPVDLLRNTNPQVEPPAPEAPPAPPAPLGLQWNQRYEPDGGFFGQQNPFVVFPDGSTATQSDAELMQRYEMTPDTLGGLRQGGVRVDPSMDTGNVAPYLPGKMVADQGGQVALDAPAADSLYGRDDGDMGLVVARERYLAQKQAAEQAAAQKEAIAAEAAKREQLAARTLDATGVKGTTAVDLFGQLEDLKNRGAIDETDFISAAALISVRENGKVRKVIAQAQAKLAQATPTAAPVQAPAAPTVPAEAPPAVLAQEQTPALPDAVARRRMSTEQLAPHVTEILARMGVDPAKPVEVKRKKVKTTITAQQLVTDMLRADDIDVAAVEGATGIDFTSGSVREPLTLDQTALLVAKRTGKKMTKQSIQARLAKYGVDKDTASLIGYASVEPVAPAELGVQGGSVVEGEESPAFGAGMRVENSASDAAASGVLEDGRSTEDPKIAAALLALARKAESAAEGWVGADQANMTKERADAAAVADFDADPTAGEDPIFVEKRKAAALARAQLANKRDEVTRAARWEEATGSRWLPGTVQWELRRALDSGNIVEGDIAEARDSYNEDLRGDDPTWDDLTPEEQADWVGTNLKDADGRITAQEYAREWGALVDRARQRFQGANQPRALGGPEATESVQPVAPAVQASDDRAAQKAPRTFRVEKPGAGKLKAVRPSTVPGEPEDTRLSTFSAVKTMPGASHALDTMGKFGIAHVVDWVDTWFTTNPRHNGDGGTYYAIGDKQVVEWRPTADPTKYGNALVDFVHEVGHAVDMASYGGGVYSTQPELAFRWQGEPVAAGSVARELATIYMFQPESPLAALFEYPLDPEKHGGTIKTAARASQEVFANLLAAYHHPALQRELKKNAPLATKFIEEVIRDIGQTTREKAHSLEAAQRRRAAFQGRADGAAQAQQQPGTQPRVPGLAQPRAESGNRAAQGPLKSKNANLDSKALSELELPGKVKGVKGFIEGVFKDGLWRAHPSLLGWLSAEQLGARFKTLPGVRQFAELTARMSGRANQIMHAADVIKRRWEALAEPDAQALGDLLLDSTGASMWPNLDFRDEKNLHIEDTPENRAQHAKLKERFRTAKPAVKQLYLDVVADFETRRQAKIEGVRRGIVATYYPDETSDTKGLSRQEVDRIADAKGKARDELVQSLGTTVRRQREIKSLVSDLTQHADTFRTNPGPYFPLMRFGNNVVSVKSKAYVTAEQELVSAQKALAAAENDSAAGTDLKAERDEVKRATTVLNKMKRSGNDYRVEFFETYGEARQFKEQADAKLGAGYEVNQSVKDQYLKSVDATSPTFMKRIEQKLGQYFQGEKGEPIKQAVREMYVQMLPENSMLKSQLKRQNVLGASRDAMRSYAASSVRDAHGISRLEYQAPLREALDTLRFDRKEIDAKIVGQELAARLQQNFEFKDHPLLGAMGNMTYLTRLGLSPSFLVTQLTQPWFISAPILASRHHMKSFGALREATAAAGKMLHADAKKQGTAHFSLDPDRALKAGQITQDESLMLKDMLDRGRIDITITQDLGATAQGRDDSWLTKATRISALPAQQLEVMNRVATALAAYRLQKQLELSRGVDNPVALERAAKYADEIVSETHLNYAAENRARHMHPNTWGGWGRIMWQFRSYQQGMIYLVMKNMIDAMRGDKEARRASAWLAGMMMASAGTTGLPGAAVVGTTIKLIYDAFKEEDDERDLRQMMYAGLEAAVGKTVADALVKGLPAAAGVDISGRVGLGNIFSPAPYADDRAEGRDMVAAYWLAAGGAAMGVAADWAEAMKLADEGKYAQAAQRALPKVVSDQIRWARESVEGRTDTRGRVLVPAEERGLGDALTRAMGFSTTDDARMGERRAAFFDAREKRDSVRQSLLTKFARARIGGEPVTEILDEIAAFNGRHPDAKITPANREAAVRSTRSRAKEMRGGVPVRERDQELAEDFGI